MRAVARPEWTEHLRGRKGTCRSSAESFGEMSKSSNEVAEVYIELFSVPSCRGGYE